MNPSHIVPVMVGDAKKCKWISDILLDTYGIYVQPINYPTVPVGHRAAAVHADPDAQRRGHLRHLVESLCDLWSQCALRQPRPVGWSPVRGCG
jgi:5-aminolevulinate synthase